MVAATKRKTELSPQREVIPGLESVLAPAFPPAVKFETLNTPVIGVVSGAKVVQAREYKDNSLKFWPSGDPLMVLVLIITIGEEEHSLWIQGANLTGEFRRALTEAGIEGIAVGDAVEVAWIGEEPVYDKKGNELSDPRKLYRVAITPC